MEQRPAVFLGTTFERIADKNRVQFILNCTLFFIILFYLFYGEVCQSNADNQCNDPANHRQDIRVYTECIPENKINQKQKNQEVND